MDAPANWEELYTETLKSFGFVRGRASACCFYHPTRDVRCVVHAGSCLYSGGLEPYLSVHSFPSHRTRLRLPPLSSSSVQLARAARTLLLCYPDCLQLWRLGNTSNTSGPIGAVLPLTGGSRASWTFLRSPVSSQPWP